MTNSYSYAIIRVWKSNIQQEGGIRNMDNVTQNEVIKTRKATPEEMKSFLKMIEKDKNWYSCDNCALRELCDRPYTNKWCDGFRFNLKEEED